MDLILVESLLDEYVARHCMGAGARMPGISDLAGSLGWREHDVARALDSATAKGRFVFVEEPKGWLVSPSDPSSRHVGCSLPLLWSWLKRLVSPSHPGSRRGYSFAKSAETHGNRLETHVLEAVRRRPTSDQSHPFYASEIEARKTLGIEPDSSFLVINRCRILNDVPGAIQRAYLDPARFPVDFVSRHDFSKESLIGIYERYHYKVIGRDTLLTARLPNQYESGLLEQRYGVRHHTPVIDAEQCLYAKDSNRRRFVLEYLRATYLENWKYEIPSRPA
jgi:DNA-binding GntR family transcriptional regulator